jgi:hypothetical protein
VVNKVLVSPGSVVRPGEPMMDIVGKHRFVVAWSRASIVSRWATPSPLAPAGGRAFPADGGDSWTETAPALAFISSPD